jgi:hypothetical protein
VKDATGQALAYCCGRETRPDADAAKVVTIDEARRIAARVSSNLNGRLLVFEPFRPKPLIGTHHKGRINMKRLFLTFAILAVATAFTAPGFAGLKDAKNKAECEKAGGVWIEKDNRCGVKTQ